MNQTYFHLHLVSDGGEEGLAAAGQAMAKLYPHISAIEHIHAQVRTPDRLGEVTAAIEREPGIVLYRIADPEMAHRLERKCRALRCPSLSLLKLASRSSTVDPNASYGEMISLHLKTRSRTAFRRRGHGPRRASRGRGLVDTVGRRATPQARLLPRGRGRRRSDAERARQGADGRQDRPRSRRPLGRLRHDARSPAAAGNREGRPWRAGAPSRACPHRGGTGREPCTSRFANLASPGSGRVPARPAAAAKAMVR